MQTIIFASNNENKIKELNTIFKDSFSIISLKQAGINTDIPEPFDTLHENAETKAKTIFELTKQNCFSEDTGLEVETLLGEPGAKSARYAGEQKNDADNINKLLFNLKDKANRRARFRTVMHLIFNSKEYVFEGICEGEIVEQPIGAFGFGYDPIFKPNGSDKTFAQMNMEEKNLFSHRKKAALQLIDFLMQHKYDIT